MNERKLLIREQTEASLQQWRENEKMALDLLRIVGELRFDKSIELLLFRKDIYDVRPSQLIHDHEVAKNYTQQNVNLGLTLPLAKAIADLNNMAPARVDIGKLAVEYMEEQHDLTVDQFIRSRLHDFGFKYRQFRFRQLYQFQYASPI